MTHVELLIDTRKYYEEDTSRRAYDPVIGCQFRLSTGDGSVIKKCAIGRFIPDEAYYPGMETKSLAMVASICPELKGLDTMFLLRVQTLHDGSSYWYEKGLTPDGIDRYNSIMEEAKLLDEKSNQSERSNSDQA